MKQLILGRFVYCYYQEDNIMENAETGCKYRTGEECPETGLYGQFHDNKNQLFW